MASIADIVVPLVTEYISQHRNPAIISSRDLKRYGLAGRANDHLQRAHMIPEGEKDVAKLAIDEALRGLGYSYRSESLGFGRYSHEYVKSGDTS
jgi:hypothetical protein